MHPMRTLITLKKFLSVLEAFEARQPGRSIQGRTVRKVVIAAKGFGLTLDPRKGGRVYVEGNAHVFSPPYRNATRLRCIGASKKGAFSKKETTGSTVSSFHDG